MSDIKNLSGDTKVTAKFQSNRKSDKSFQNLSEIMVNVTEASKFLFNNICCYYFSIICFLERFNVTEALNTSHIS